MPCRTTTSNVVHHRTIDDLTPPTATVTAVEMAVDLLARLNRRCPNVVFDAGQPVRLLTVAGDDGRPSPPAMIAFKSFRRDTSTPRIPSLDKEVLTHEISQVFSWYPRPRCRSLRRRASTGSFRVATVQATRVTLRRQMTTGDVRSSTRSCDDGR